MTKTAKGTFEVKGTPLPADKVCQEMGAMRMSFEKRFQGDFEGTSIVAMTGIMNHELGSGAYVALEWVTGTLNGRKGTFHLQHCSAVSRGKPLQSVTVVPDSGTGGLADLTGSMVIDIVGEEHFYTFEYTLERSSS